MRKSGLFARSSDALSHWMGEKLIEHWPAILVIALSTSTMTYLASITGWISAYGPVAWGATGILTLLVLSIAYFIYANAISRSAFAEYSKKKAESSAVNVLSPVHENQKVILADFYHHFFKPTENARFENCDLMGPAYIGMEGCNFINCGFIDCEIVVVRADRGIKGASMFRFCTFLRSRLYRVTFLMNIETYRALPEEMKAKISVISDGRIGDI